jgi:hypothetical protein
MFSSEVPDMIDSTKLLVLALNGSNNLISSLLFICLCFYSKDGSLKLFLNYLIAAD